MFFSTVLADSSSSGVSVSIVPNLALSVVDSNGVQNLVSVDITPSANGVFGKGSTNVIVSTTNETGYTLTMSGADDNTALVHTNVSSATIPTVSSDVVEAEFPVNRYGYNFNDVVSGSTTDLLYSALPTLSAPTTLATTSTNGSATYPFTIGAKADTAIPSGTYQNTIVFSATANYVPPTVYEFDYTGTEQEFTAPKDGLYRLEAWAGQGGGATENFIGGYGAYSVGDIQLNKGDRLYINVGQVGVSNNDSRNEVARGSYNGGGQGGYCTTGSYGQIWTASGGGATHMATESGLLETFESKRDKLVIVSGGGGGAFYHNNASVGSYGNGGNGGGYTGNNGATAGSYTVGGGGTQVAGGAGPSAYPSTFGAGGYGVGANINGAYYSGGGGGYYGGAASVYAGAGGGSGYIGNIDLINKHMACYSCSVSDEEQTKTISNTCSAAEPTADCAKQGNGYARITGPL